MRVTHYLLAEEHAHRMLWRYRSVVGKESDSRVGGDRHNDLLSGRRHPSICRSHVLTDWPEDLRGQVRGWFGGMIDKGGGRRGNVSRVQRSRSFGSANAVIGRPEAVRRDRQQVVTGRCQREPAREFVDPKAGAGGLKRQRGVGGASNCLRAYCMIVSHKLVLFSFGGPWEVLLSELSQPGLEVGDHLFAANL